MAIMRDLVETFLSLDLDEVLHRYNEIFDEIDRPHLDMFLAKLLAVPLSDPAPPIQAFLTCYESHHGTPYFHGRGWFEEGATLHYRERGDLEWRAASDVLAMEFIDESGVDEITRAVFTLEEFGVYLNDPRIDS